MVRNHPTRSRVALSATILASLVGLASAPAAASGGSIEIIPDGFRLLVLIVFFTLLVWPANKVLWQPLLRVLEERTLRIEGTRERGRALAAEADEVFARYQDSVDEARDAAVGDTRTTLEQARREQGRVTSEARRSAEDTLAAARGELADALTGARQELRSQIEGLARVAASRALGREIG